MIRVADRLWGGTSHLTGDPSAKTHLNAVYVPFDKTKYIADDNNWGIFDEAGVSIEAALYRRGYPAQQVSGGKAFTGLVTERASPEYDYVYLGPFMQHYGHFITATMARCWYPYRHWSKRTKYILHSEEEIDLLFSHSYSATCLERLGLSRENVVRFSHPTRISHLTVPEPAFEEQNFGSALFRDMGRYIGAPFRSNDRSSQPVYLSKQRLPAGVGKFSNEDILVEHLRLEGFIIVHPEQLSLPQQICLFNKHSYVVGSGSGLHTALFCDLPPTMISLTISEVVNSNFVLFDNMIGCSTVHIMPGGGLISHHYADHIPKFIEFMRHPNRFSSNEMHDDVSGFVSAAEILEPGQFAADITQILRTKGAFT